MNQDDLNKIMAGERITELKRLHDELNTLKWAGADEAWDAAVDAVCKHIEARGLELSHRYLPEAVDAALAKTATVPGMVGAA